jgi:predicted acetyltransferase
MDAPRVILVRPSVEYRDSYLEGLREIAVDSEQRAWLYMPEDVSPEFPNDDFDGYVAALLAREHTSPQGFVCDTVYWGIRQNEMVGRIAIRHTLNEFLATLGGHIGYVVRPSHRGRGLAAEMLRQALLTGRAKTIGRLLLTCDEGNIASEKTIRKNGGGFESTVDAAPGNPRKKRFWIDLGASQDGRQ